MNNLKVFNNKTNIFDLEADAYVNPVNTEGYMGKGLAFDFKIRYPDMFDQYHKLCKENIFKIGQVFTYETNQSNPKYIINFPTKQRWSNPSKLEYINSGLIALEQKLIRTPDIKTIAIPALGCGLGMLDWDVVSKLITDKLISIPVSVILIEPHR